MLFVSITVASGSSTQQGIKGTRAFSTPTLIPFGAVLFQSLVALALWPSAWPAGMILGLCGIAGFVNQVYVIFKQVKVDMASLDWLDWALFSAVPALGQV